MSLFFFNSTKSVRVCDSCAEKNDDEVKDKYQVYSPIFSYGENDVHDIKCKL